VAGAEQLPCFIEEMAVSGTEQSVESYLDEALGPDVLKKAADEFFSGDFPKASQRDVVINSPPIYRWVGHKTSC